MWLGCKPDFHWSKMRAIVCVLLVLVAGIGSCVASISDCDDNERCIIQVVGSFCEHIPDLKGGPGISCALRLARCKGVAAKCGISLNDDAVNLPPSARCNARRNECQEITALKGCNNTNIGEIPGGSCPIRLVYCWKDAMVCKIDDPIISEIEVMLFNAASRVRAHWVLNVGTMGLLVVVLLCIVY